MEVLFSKILVFLLLFATISCATRFSEDEQQILSGSEDKLPLRVYLITQKEDSILLRTPSSKINWKKDKEWAKKLADKMLVTVTDSASMGVGIAAPQVGVLKQMVLVQRFDKPNFPFETYINPKIVKYSVEKQECEEGCLSIPNFSAKLYTRAKEITLKYRDVEGKKHKEVIKDFTAVIFQHEIDHLNGILFIDHLSDEVQYSQ